MWRNGNASVWSLLKYHFSELWWPEFWNHKAIEIRRIANVKTPLKYYSRGLRWTEFWNHKVIGMLRIGNASVWTPLKYHSSGLWPPYPTGMTFQWGPNTGIANFAHCYYRISSNLQNFGPQSPLEWYFNGVQTLAMLILRIAISLWVQECKIPATISPQIEWYFNGVLTLSILHIPMALWFQSSGHHSLLVWYFNGVLAWLILNIPIPLWFKISCHIAHWNDT